MKDKNFEKLRTMRKKIYEGKVIGLADGEIVASDKDLTKVMNILKRDYSDKNIMITSIPKKDVNFVL